MYQYERAEATGGGLRLHLNENTAGCSPRVLAAIQAMTRLDAAIYPDYAPTIDACAGRFDLPADNLLLTNGLDEGILALTVSACKGAVDPDAIVIVPAFDMYAACADAIGCRVVEVPLAAGYTFPLDDVLQAIGPRTRIVWITNPHNPTGQVVPREAILHIAVSAAHAIVAVDEAYAEFAGCTLLDRDILEAHPNLVVGRTFAKAWGLAGLRAGALFARADTLAPVRRIVPPYTLNSCAAAALPVALGDEAYFAWYLAQVEESKALLYDAFDRLRVEYWPSAANFVLARPADCASVVKGLAQRGVHVRDKSRDLHCPGCLRVTAGVVEDTRAFITALEEVLCGAV